MTKVERIVLEGIQASGTQEDFVGVKEVWLGKGKDAVGRLIYAVKPDVIGERLQKARELIRTLAESGGVNIIAREL